MGIEYKKIKPKKLYEEVADALHELIKSGKLKPGDKLDSVQQLAENFQVGRSAIREALSALRALGLIEIKQGEGTYIKRFNEQKLQFGFSPVQLMNKADVIHLLEVRRIVEIGAVASAAKNRTEQDIKDLYTILARMKDGFGNVNIEEETDIHFHLAISKAAHNPMLYHLMQNVSYMMEANMKETRSIWLLSEEHTVTSIYRDHVRIVEAIVEQDEEKAQRSMWDHLTVVEKNLSAFYDESKS